MYQGIAVERLDRINGEFILNWIKAVKNNHEDETTNKKSKIHFKIYNGFFIVWLSTPGHNFNLTINQVIIFLKFFIDEMQTQEL